MATTTNYGWTTPNDTDLVKDGASAIRTLGSSIDTTTKALNPSTTLGDIEYRSSTANTNTRLGIGSSGQVLTVSGGVPAWAAASSGGITLIQEVVANANTGIDFTSISGSYKQLLLVWSGIVHSTGSTAFQLRCNADSANNYSRREGYISTVTALATLGDTSNFGSNMFGFDCPTAGIVNNSAGQILIDNYASSTKFKPWLANYGYNDAATDFYQYVSQGTYMSQTAITELNIVRTAGSGTMSNAGNTTIRLYGIS